MNLNEWKKFWWKIDLIGIVLGLSLVLFYIFYSDITASDEVKNIWANFATEIVGVWLSVRIIGEILDKKSKFRNARFVILDNIKFFYTTARRVLEYKTNFSSELFDLNKEKQYFDLRWNYRKQFLSESEVEKVIELREMQNPITDLVKQIEDISSANNFDYEENTNYKNLKENLRLSLEGYEILLDELRDDIWEETHPDRA